MKGWKGVNVLRIRQRRHAMPEGRVAPEGKLPIFAGLSERSTRRSTKRSTMRSRARESRWARRTLQRPGGLRRDRSGQLEVESQPRLGGRHYITKIGASLVGTRLVHSLEAPELRDRHIGDDSAQPQQSDQTAASEDPEHEEREPCQADRPEGDRQIAIPVHGANLAQARLLEPRLRASQTAQLATAAGTDTMPIRSIMSGSAA